MSETPVVIVTGASRGIGYYVACWLGKWGAHLSLVARSVERLQAAAKDVEGLGGKALAIEADVADAYACRRAVDQTVERFDRVDALVNNAGIFRPLASVASCDPEEWRYNVAVNLLGPFYMTHAAIPHLVRQRGRVVNVTSGAASIVVQAGSAYCASKAALNQFTRVLAAEEPSLTAVAVRPGVVDTQMQALLRSEGPGVMTPAQVAYYEDLKRDGDLEPPSVPARSIAWLALDAPHERSGELLNYDDPQIMEPSRQLFGEGLGRDG